MTMRGLFLLAALIVWMGVRPLDAAPPPPARDLTELTLDELTDVKVTSVSKETEDRSRTAAAVFVISQEDIRRSGATNIAEVLRLAPGVEVARIDSGHWAVGVRGFGDQFSKSVLVLVDGRSVYTPLFAGVFWAVQDTVLADVDRIEVIRGPGGTIWGANAVNGVINIITKGAGATHGPLALITAGTIDRVAELRYGAGNDRNLDYRVYGKLLSRGPEFHADESEFDDWRMGQAGARVDWKVADGNTLTFQGDGYGGELGQRVSLASLSPPSQVNADQPLDVSGGNLLVKWRRELAGDGDVQVQAYYDRTRLAGPQLEETRDTFDVDFVHHLTLPRRQEFIWGLGARSSPSTFVAVVPTLDFDPRQKTNSVYTAFVQDEVPMLGDRLALTVGAKLEHNDDTGLELLPSARVRASLGSRHALWASATRAVRTPSRIERDFKLIGLLAPRPLTVVQIDGSREFGPERLVGYEAGYRGVLGSRLYLDVAAFHNDYDDLASFGPASVTADAAPARTTLHFAFANGLEGSSNGFEITTDWRAARAWRLQAWYAFLDIQLRNKPGNEDAGAVATAEGSSPRHQISVQSRFTLPKGIELDQTLRYVSDLPARAIKAYTTLDARLSWPIGRGFQLAVVGQNLLQPQHAEFAHDPGPTVQIRRAAYIQIGWRR